MDFKFVSKSTKAKQPTYYQSFDKSLFRGKHDRSHYGNNMTLDQSYILPTISSVTGSPKNGNIDDVKTLLSFYKCTKDESWSGGKTSETIYEEDLFKKFNITGKINNSVSKQVSSYLHNDPIHKAKTIDVDDKEYNGVLTDDEKVKLKASGRIKVFDYHYNNPINALENLKINKSIHDNITSIVNDFSQSRNGGFSLAPINNRYLRKQKIKIRSLESDTPIAIKKLIEGEQPYNKGIVFKNKGSRTEFFGINTDIVGKYYSQHIDYPCSRSQASMVLYRDHTAQTCKIYLFGGMGITRFNDLWVFDICK
jgi:hypothetical protein